MGKQWPGEAAVEAEIDPVVELVALAPPEEALGVVERAGAIAELDELEEIVDVGAGEKNSVGEIDDEGGGGVIGDDHVAAEERGTAAGVEKARSACAGEAQDSADHVRWPCRNVGDDGAFAAAGGPTGRGAGFGEVALARFENHADLMHAGGNASCCGGGATAGSGESADRRGESEVRGIGDAGDWERAVVTGYADAAGSYKLPGDEAMRSGGLNRRGGGGCGAAAGSGESGSAGDVGELRGARRGDDGKGAVVSGDADARNGQGLACGKAVRGGGGNGNEKTVFGGAVGAGGDRDGSGLRGAVGTGGDGNAHVFIDEGRTGSGAALADAVEIGVVVLARQVVAGFSVADGEVFPAEERGRIGVGVGRESGGDARERAGSGFFVEHAVGVEHHGAQGGVQRFVGLDVIDGRVARQRAEERLQARASRHAAVAEDDVLAIGRDAVRQIRRGHIGHQPAEDFDCH